MSKKMSKKIYFILIALLMVLTVSCVSAAEDTNDTVAAVDEEVEVQTAIDDVPLQSDDDADVLSTGTQDPNFSMKPDCNDYGDVSFSASTEKDATGTVHVKFILKSPGGDTVQAEEILDLVNGSVKWGGPGNYLPKGAYIVLAEYSGDDKYASVTRYTPDTGPDAFNVPKIPVSLNFTSIAVNEKGNIVVNGQLDNPKADGPYVLTFTNKDNGKTAVWYRQQVQSGGIIVNEKTPELGAGEYIVTISYVGTDQYFPAIPQEKNINISEIIIESETIIVGPGDEIESGASLNPAGAGNLTFVSSNESVAKVDPNTGVITGVGFGNATVTVSCAGNDMYGPAINKTIAVTVKITTIPTFLNAESFEMYVGDGTKYAVNLTDRNGKPVAGMGIKVNITGKTYTIITDENGTAVLPINLKAGIYPVTAVFNGNGNYLNATPVSTNVSVMTKVRIDQHKDMTKDYGDSDKFTVHAVDKYGKSVGAYAKVKMTIAGKTYTVNTDANGYASLAINMKPGTYDITCEYGGYSVKHKITVKQVLSATNRQYKKASSYQFTATLKHSNGKAITGKTVTFTFKGKTYTQKTNAKGEATITIKEALNLGKYNIAIKYLDSTITKSITIK